MLQKIGRAWESERDNLLVSLSEFAAIMQARPFQNHSGLRGVSAFAFYYFLRQLKPTLVFEVGVWKGFSTWLIEQAVPEARIFCFDPIFSLSGLLDETKMGP